MYSKFLKFTESNCVANQPGLELIELNTRRGPDSFYDAESFKNAYFDYMSGKYKSDDVKTDKNNNCQVVNAVNALYLDGDWIFPDNIKKKEYSTICYALADKYLNAWCEELDNNNIFEYYYFTFIPDEFPDGKGGFHVMIICNEKISSDERIRMYENVKRSFCEIVESEFSNYIRRGKDESIQSIYNQLFDIGPIKTKQLLLPFAQKSPSSRQYILRDKKFNFDKGSQFFIFPSEHDVYDTSTEHPLESNIDVLLNEKDVTDESVMNLMNDIEQNAVLDWKNLGVVGKITANFMQSLIYLSDGHIFWKKMKDNSERLKYIITPLIQFISVNYFIEHRGYLPDNNGNQFVHSLTKIMLPLLKYTTKGSNEKTERDTYKSCYNHIKNYYNKYSGVKQAFNEENVAFWREYVQMTVKEKKSLPFKGLIILGTIKKQFQKMFSNWTKFVTEIVLNGITDEIQPFRPRSKIFEDPRYGVTFDDVIPGQANVNTSMALEESFYVHTMRLWSLMFLFVEYYNTNSVQEAIRAVISAFIRYYIWDQKNANGETTVYIYNIHQTKTLTAFPYNQWILDRSDGDNLRSWVKSIYLQFIKKELLTTNKTQRLIPFIENLSNACIPIQDNYINAVKPLSNFDSDMDKIFKNVLSAFTQERYAPPKELSVTTSPYFPMRNGILEFKEDGSYRFHTDNHDKFMNGYTNVVWDDKYDYESPEYKAVNKMIRKIYPIEEEREFALYMYSSVLHGIGLRDLFIILFGTGGDGKTTMSNAIQAMLGGDGISQHVQMEENGKIVYVENPCGLSSSMKTETILTSNKSTHDEGGVIQLKNKRYCSVQEPDPNLSGGKINCAKVKEILSGTPLVGRGIYKKAEAFVTNCLLTLQTNVMLGYSEDTDAIRRRISVVLHRAKFTTSVNKDKMETLEFKHKADPMLNSHLTNNPKYWQALFYVLLPYAQNLIKMKYLPLSNIPRPKSIIDSTNESFAHSNGLVGWLNKEIVKFDGKVICIADLIRTIRNYHNAERKNSGGILTTNNVHGQTTEICQQLFGTYIGRIYKLKSKFYNVRKNEIRSDFEIIVPKGCTNEQIIDKYFNKYAVESMERSDVIDKSDLYIIGYIEKNKINDELDNDSMMNDSMINDSMMNTDPHVEYVINDNNLCDDYI